MSKPFTETEQQAMDALILAFNKFAQLERTHPDHARDFTDGIHKCQSVLVHRVVQRDYPDTFPAHN